MEFAEFMLVAPMTTFFPPVGKYNHKKSDTDYVGLGPVDPFRGAEESSWMWIF